MNVRYRPEPTYSASHRNGVLWVDDCRLVCAHMSVVLVTIG